jgi:hypothetical protein
MRQSRRFGQRHPLLSGIILELSRHFAEGQQRDENRGKSDYESAISRPGNRNCGCAHEIAGDDQQERMPAVAYRYTCGGGVASAF